MSRDIDFRDEHFSLEGHSVTLRGRHTFELPDSQQQYYLVEHAGRLACIGDFYLAYNGAEFKKVSQLPSHTSIAVVGDVLVLLYFNKVSFCDCNGNITKQIRFAPDQIGDVYAIQKQPLQLLCFVTRQIHEGNVQFSNCVDNEASFPEIFAGFNLNESRLLAAQLNSCAGTSLQFEKQIERESEVLDTIQTNIHKLDAAITAEEKELDIGVLEGVRDVIQGMQAKFDEQFKRLEMLQNEEIRLLELRKATLLKKSNRK